MKCIYPDNVTAVLADEANANYPDDNISNDHPKKVWKATSEDAKITLTVSEGSNCVGIFNTNGTTITVTVKNAAEDTILVAAQEFDLSGIDTYYKLITDSGSAWTSLWIDYDYQAVEHKVIIDFERGSGIIEAGVIRAGRANNFKNPKYGIKEGRKDYSIIKELNNGAFYIRKRDIVKTFGGSIFVERDREFYEFMTDIVTANGASPLAWKVTDQSEHDWTVFARFSGMPNGVHKTKNYGEINFNLLEVV